MLGKNLRNFIFLEIFGTFSKSKNHLRAQLQINKIIIDMQLELIIPQSIIDAMATVAQVTTDIGQGDLIAPRKVVHARAALELPDLLLNE